MCSSYLESMKLVSIYYYYIVKYCLVILFERYYSNVSVFSKTSSNALLSNTIEGFTTVTLAFFSNY